MSVSSAVPRESLKIEPEARLKGAWAVP